MTPSAASMAATRSLAGGTNLPAPVRSLGPCRGQIERTHAGDASTSAAAPRRRVGADGLAQEPGTLLVVGA
ncbi:hypothetical protein BE17_20125 [Sorangium cellulosum]|uniref:Uncharacterized protein n=1 Tax=Sorangium cellulosum TaxID=56 RepID=A0A150R3L4_SORCE|nr:hypothetical protein BE17_20125 [Sorangium cellulosum]